MNNDTLKKGRVLVLIFGLLMVVFECIELALTSELNIIRWLLEIALFAAVYFGYNWARILSVVLFGLGGAFGLVDVFFTLDMGPTVSGPNHTTTMMPDALIIYTAVYSIFCIIAALVFGISKPIKALSSQRKTKL